MLGWLRRVCHPALASQSTRPVLATSTSSKALHTTPSVGTKAYPQASTEPYLYTTGRWLHRDKIQREARSIMFDFPALCMTAVKAHQHMLCVKSVTFMVTEMAKLPFPAYGSLYFADAPIDPQSKIDFADGFCVGPHCGTQYWGCNAGETRFYEDWPPNRGPWTELQSYCSGLIDAGFSRIPKENSLANELPYRGSVQEHLRLLSISEKVIVALIEAPIIQDVAGPTLLHPDIHKRNIYVSDEDPSFVTAIIDWQSTSIEPTFVYAIETPDLVEDPAADVPILENLMSSPEDHASIVETAEKTAVQDSKEDAAKKRHEKDVLTCRQTFEVILRGYLRKLHNARAMDQTLLRTFRYCDASWRDSAAALRQELIELSQRWTELGLRGSCPYQPTPEELTEHATQYEDFETLQQLKIFFKRALDVDSDGWIPAENWEVAREEHRKIFAAWVESIRESGVVKIRPGNFGHLTT